MDTAELIEKEEVINYKLVDAAPNQNITKEKLERALRLGNEYKSKTVITFQTHQGPKKIETTVWTLTENHIQIKSSVSIPIKSLIDIS
ncbi:MAG: hypothetical protein ACK5IC_02565 [Moheibacter sp.]